MGQEEYAKAEAPKAIHHATRRGADLAIARKEISQESYAAVLKGRLSLSKAKELGRNAGPEGAVRKVTTKATKKTTEPTLTPCLCGCSVLVTRLFKPGHDAKMHRIAREYVRGERELTDEQRQYVEQSGNRVLARVEEPERLSEGGSGGFTGAPDMSHEPRPEERCGES